MNDIFCSYPKYKDSNVSWLEQIPTHWKKVHGGSVLKQNRIKNRGMIEDTVLSLSYGKIVVKPPEKLHGLVPESFETYQIVDPYDIIVRPTDLQNDWVTIRVGISYKRGIITSAYICMRTRESLNPEYAYLLLLAYDLKKIFYGMGSGLRQNLDWSDFKRLPILIPPPDEQEQIVTYIKNIDLVIARFIQNQKRLIALLKEQKQAIINHAVTKGLDPDAKMKPSGIEWLGDIPEFWVVKKLKKICSGFHNGTSAFQIGEGFTDYRVTRIETISRGNINLEKVGYLKPEDAKDKYLLKNGDILLSNINSYARIGNTAMYSIDTPLYHGMNLLRLTPLNNFNNNYLLYFFKTTYFISEMQRRCKPAINQVSVPSSSIKTIAVPNPQLAEQEKIVHHIGKETQNIDKTIESINKEIDLITEYRNSLISSVVTGKVDVRNVKIVESLDEPLEDMDADFGNGELPEEVIHEMEVG